MTAFASLPLPDEPTVTAPDGSDVRVLLGLAGGGLAHFELATGRTTRAVRHRTVEEIWYVTGGTGQMWRRQGTGPDAMEEITDLAPGLCLTIPVGTAFQFTSTGDEPLTVVAVTMPPWPGPDEAVLVNGRWPVDVPG